MQMWIKYLVLSLLLLFPSMLLSDCVVSFVSPVFCVPDTSTYVMTHVEDDEGQGLGADAYGQSVSYTGDNWVLSQIKIQFGSITTAGATATVRIGATADLTTYMEEWQITLDGGLQLYTCTSIDNDTYTDGTTYYIGIIETSGTVLLRYADSNAYAGGDWLYPGAGTGWDMQSSNGSRDAVMEVLRCTP